MVYIEFTMKDTLTVTQGQAQFPALCRKEKTSAITRNGEVVAFIVPRKRMTGLLEQMEILANPEAMTAIQRAKAGKTVDHPLSVLDEG
jgi:antitoxin (DNA-binding transcriptional repressor) of toxin-antitoxin stability system